MCIYIVYRLWEFIPELIDIFGDIIDIEDKLVKNSDENICPCIAYICSGGRHKEISKYMVKSNNEEGTRRLEVLQL